jgi:hypothetical protein
MYYHTGKDELRLHCIPKGKTVLLVTTPTKAKKRFVDNPSSIEMYHPSYRKRRITFGNALPQLKEFCW